MFSVEEVTQKKVYNQLDFSSSVFMEGKFLQSWEWGEFIKKTGNKITRFIIKDKNKKIIGRATLVLKKMLPFFSYAYCPCGPELDYKKLKTDELNQIFKILGDSCKKSGCFFLRFNPPLLENHFCILAGLKLSQAKTKQPEKTLYLSLKKDPEELLANMKAKTRYNIRLASKKNILIKQANSPEAIDAFLKLTKDTGVRDGFVIYPEKYYRTMIASLQKSGFLKIYTAFYQGEPLASNLIIFNQGVATYLHGASSNQHRNLMAPHLLQWQAILDAKKQGFDYYDFWGIDEKKWPGVTRFKMGFGGNIAEFHPTYEIPIQENKYSLYSKVRQLVKR